MKIEDIVKQTYITLADGGVQLCDYTISKDEIRRFVDDCRLMQAKANRLNANVETLSRPIDLQDITEFQLTAHLLQEALFGVLAFLARTEGKLLNYQLLYDELTNIKPKNHATN